MTLLIRLARGNIRLKVLNSLQKVVLSAQCVFTTSKFTDKGISES